MNFICCWTYHFFPAAQLGKWPPGNIFSRKFPVGPRNSSKALPTLWEMWQKIAESDASGTGHHFLLGILGDRRRRQEQFKDDANTSSGSRRHSVSGSAVGKFSDSMSRRRRYEALVLDDTKNSSQLVCLSRAVFPMRYCEGSIVPTVWEKNPQCIPTKLVVPVVSWYRAIWKPQEFPGEANKSISPEVYQITVIHRQQATTRRMQNNDAIVSELQRSLVEPCGTFYIGSRRPARTILIRVVDFADLNYAEQQQVIFNTTLLVGTTGAALTNVLFLSPQSAGLLELTPWYLSEDSTGRTKDTSLGFSAVNIFRNFADWVGVPYRAVPAHSVRGEHVTDPLALMSSDWITEPRMVACVAKEMLVGVRRQSYIKCALHHLTLCKHREEGGGWWP